MKYGSVEIQLDKPRTLRFSMNSFAAFEDLVGVTIPAFMMDLARESGDNPEVAVRSFGFKRLRSLLWAALLEESPGLKIEEVSNLFDAAPGDSLFDKMTYVYAKVLEAFNVTQGPQSKKKDADLPALDVPSAAGTGMKS